jgi:hypothetical protein
MKVNLTTAVMAGGITSCGVICMNYITKRYSIHVTLPIEIISEIALFLIPCITLVIGASYIKESTLHRIKHFGFKSFIFPSSREDFFVLIRILVYFFTTVLILTYIG